MININEELLFNKIKGIFNNDIFSGNLKIMGFPNVGKSTLLFSLVKYNLKKHTQVVLINKIEEKSIRDSFKEYKNKVNFIYYEPDFDFEKILLEHKNRTLFIVVNYYNYVFKEDEESNEIIKKINENKDDEKIKVYISEAHRSDFLNISRDYIIISRKKNIDYICDTQEFENCNDFKIKLVFKDLKRRGFGRAFFDLDVGEFKVIKNKKLIKLSSKELYIKGLLKDF